jgi:hypothetical protein
VNTKLRNEKFVVDNFLVLVVIHSKQLQTTTKQAGVLVGSALAGLFEMMLFGMK